MSTRVGPRDFSVMTRCVGTLIIPESTGPTPPSHLATPQTPRLCRGPALPGSVHDAKAIKESGFLETLDTTTHIGDKGYIGLGMITPAKKPAHGELTDSDKRNNTTINRVRYLIERVIANLKTWRVLHTDYRRPYNTFETTIQAVTGLIFAYTL